MVAGGNCDAGNDLDDIKRHALAWDGLSYAHVGTLAEARDNSALAGTMNAALAQGGGSNSSYSANSAHSTCTEEWNGSAWSEAAASNFPTGGVVMAAGKSSNDAMHVYDCTNSDPKTDFYNGVAWSLGPNMNGLGGYKNSGATGTTGKSFFMAANCTDVEHFDENHTTSSMGRVDATELSLESDTDLTIDESLQIPLYGGNPPVTSSAGEVWYNTEQEKLYFTYDVNSWTELANTNTARIQLAGLFGTTGAALHYGGLVGPSPNPATDDTEEWNGTAWTEGNNLITGRQHGGFNGTQNTAWVAGGNTPSNASTVEHYNGTSWSSQTALPAAHGGLAGAGTQNAGIVFGGMSSPYIAIEWNGQVWTSVDNMNSSHARWNGDGTQANALAVGQSGVTETYTTTAIGCACIGGV